MIIGIGHDLVEIGRVRRIVEGKTAQAFLQRVLTTEELRAAENAGGRRAEYVAGRFAVKEAVSKAFGCGIGARMGFRDLCVLPDAAGKPVCTLSAEAWNRLGFDPDSIALHVSITHDGGLASAFAVVERRDGYPKALD